MPEPAHTDLGLVDITAILRPGVFILWHNSRITYIGRARCLLAGIAARYTISRADLPTWIPLKRIIFDQVQIIPCDTTRAIALADALIKLHNPYHNRTHRAPPPIHHHPVPDAHTATSSNTEPRRP